MNAAPTKLDLYRQEVLPPEKQRELYSSLPAYIRPAVFERNLMNALMANPSLMDFPAPLVYREVAKAAGLGLLLDPLLGEAYIVTAYNYKTKKTEPQLRVGYKGMCKLARHTGNVTTIASHEVHALDDVDVDLGVPKVFHHRPKLFGDRGQVIGYVAQIVFKDGTFDIEPMSVEQCHEIRDRSDAWKAFKDGKIKSTPWSTDDMEMCKKTTLRRLLKRQSQSTELVRAIEIEDEAEFPDMRRVEAPRVPSVPRVPSPNDQKTIEHQPEQDPDLPDDPEAAQEVAKGKPEPDTRSRSTDEPHDADQAPQGPDPDSDYEGFLEWAREEIFKCESIEELEEMFNRDIESRANAIMPPDLTELVEVYEATETRLKAKK
jgi:recombination protein RecT